MEKHLLAVICACAILLKCQFLSSVRGKSGCLGQRDGDDVDDADGYKGQQGGCRARSLWQYGLPMHRLNILNLPALKMMRILTVLIMTMILRMVTMVMILRMMIMVMEKLLLKICTPHSTIATKVLSVKIHFRNPSLRRSIQVIAKPFAERVSNKSIQLIPIQRGPLGSELVWTIFDALALSRLTASCI